MEESKKTTIVVSRTLDNSGAFSVPIYVPFVPKEVVVSNMNYYNDGTETTDFSRLTTSMIQSLDGCIGVFQDGSMGSMMNESVSFRVGRPVRGDIEFRFSNENRAGTLCFTLTFLG